MKEDKKYRDRQRFLEKYLILQAQDASVVWVGNGNGRISPLVRLSFAGCLT
jgi:hypothetical protein